MINASQVSHAYAREIRPKKVKSEKPIYIGIDGEGVDYGGSRQDHRYTLLAACTEKGPYARQWYVENPAGLSTKECLDFLLELPRSRHKLRAFSFNYDLTKALADLDDARLYLLFRPELRKRTGKHAHTGPKPIHWQGYEINLQGTKFRVALSGEPGITLWDTWKFYQTKFTKALKDWKTCHPDIIARIETMKDKRNAFASETAHDIRNYCFSECAELATLSRQLDEAHVAAGLELTSYYGCGSTATAMFKKMGIREKIRGVPEEMTLAVAQGFFGGHFEHSVVGSITEPVYNDDISSAYPYQLCFLPCLQHGNWRLSNKRKDLESCRTALVHYALDSAVKCSDWAPFPYREPDGSISFPAQSGGGWVWKDEYLGGEAGWPNLVQFREAWVYECDCLCQPFKEIPHYYRERMRIGKEGAGIVFKNGPNSGYGKLAQSIGSAPFNSWTWAGLVTSGTRAQLNALICLAKDRRNVLGVATDGVYSTENITTPIPRDTGTGQTGKPLGGWEKKDYLGGVFFARPGIYFPLNPTKDDLDKVRARGIGKGILLNQWAEIVNRYDRLCKSGSLRFEKGDEFRVQNVDRFCGAKTSISYRASDKQFVRAEGGREKNGQRLPAYGQWITRPVQMSFDPMPKRDGLVRDSNTRLALRRLPLGIESTPYKKSLLSKDGLALLLAQQELEEQPDIDWHEALEEPYDE